MSLEVSRLGKPALTWVRALDRHRLAPVVVMGFAALSLNAYALRQSPRTQLARQVKRMSPDAQLYWGLARNLFDGTGYFDTIRDREILPSVGHPMLMAFGWSTFGLTPAQYTLIVLWLATLLTTWAVYRYAASALAALAALAFQWWAYSDIPWGAANVECSLFFANAVLLAALAELHRASRWHPWGPLAGLALALQLLVRPVLLYPVHLLAGLGVVVLVVPRLRRAAARSPRLGLYKALWAAAIVAELVLGAVRVHSAVVYGDSREVTGTYGAWALYRANNEHVPPESPSAAAKNSERWLELARLVSSRYGPPEREMGWEERHRLLMAEVIQYWKTYPGRALRGYFWRMRHMLGLSDRILTSGLARKHTPLIWLLFALAAANLWRKKTRWGLGVLTAAMVLVYAMLHGLFVWAGFRYVTPLFSLMTVGICFALCDLLRGRLPGDSSSEKEALAHEPSPHGELAPADTAPFSLQRS